MLRSCWRRPLLALWLFLSLSHVLAAPTDIPSAASFYVPSIPGVEQDPNHPLRIYAGHLSADPNISRVQSNEVTAHIYFLLVKNRRIADKERIIFWFNGGPGCSSFDGLMMEVGPWRWDGKSFKVKEGGWEEYATVVYVDQPPGTGFSYTSTDHYLHTMDDAKAHFMEFLRNFYQVFPEYKHMDTYLAGESFAGQWIPYYADAILNSNLRVPLLGAAIGNGWIDPKRHYPSYLDFAVKVGVLEENSPEFKRAKLATDECVEIIEKLPSDPMLIEKCQHVIFEVASVRNRKVNGVDMCLNIYDVRLDDTSPACGMNWPPDMVPVTSFLGRPDVVNAIHAQAHPGSWRECRPDVHRAFRESKQQSSFTVLPKVLAKIPVLIFAGDQDLICNYVGLENSIKALEWNGATGLGTVQTQSWNVAGAHVGTWVDSRNLTYVKIFNASHMAPYDVPHVTHDMMLRFMGVDFKAIVEGSAKIPSSVGSTSKPIFVGQEEVKQTPAVAPAKTPEQDKAMWEAYYNAGSAALVLVLIFLVIGLFVWCRVRRKRVVKLPTTRPDEDEENIPLNPSSLGERQHDEISSESMGFRGKGKERSRNGNIPPPEEPPIFDVGDSDDDEEYKKQPGGAKDV